MGAFEDALRAQIEERSDAWGTDRETLEAANQRRADTIDLNRRAVASFVEAMVTAGAHPERWKVRSRTIDDKKHRHRPTSGWPISLGGSTYFVTRAAEVLAVREARAGHDGDNVLWDPEPADLGRRSLAPGLAAAYRAANHERELP